MCDLVFVNFVLKMPETGRTSASGTNANVSGNNTDLNVSIAMMTSMAECFTLQHSTLNIPFYDGKNIPLKNFLQDIRNGAVFVPPALESSFLKAVLGKLQKTARDSTWGKTFYNLDELIKHLKARFGSDKTYPDYHHEIENIRMNRGETVNYFHDRLNILFNGAKTVLEDKYPENAGQMLESIKEVALEAFIRGLPDEITRAVDARDPKNLEEALKFARRAELKSDLEYYRPVKLRG